jgi:hypothetical protein
LGVGLSHDADSLLSLGVKRDCDTVLGVGFGPRTAAFE